MTLNLIHNTIKLRHDCHFRYYTDILSLLNEEPSQRKAATFFKEEH